AYLIRKGDLHRLTKDHTPVERMLDAGMISPKEARTHPDASVLNRAIGNKPEVEIEIGPSIPLEDGDALLLCSDGLSGFAVDAKIRKTIRSHSQIQQIPAGLKELALKSGSDDNITIQFVRFGKTPTTGSREAKRLRALLQLQPRSRRILILTLVLVVVVA